MRSTRKHLLANSMFSDILSKVELHDYQGCLELRWDKSDIGTIAQDTGVVFKAGNRFVVASLIDNQLRYYASAENVPAGLEWDYEVGFFAGSNGVLAFLDEYLVSGLGLLDIVIPRTILRAGLEPRHTGAVCRLHTDERDDLSKNVLAPVKAVPSQGAARST